MRKIFVQSVLCLLLMTLLTGVLYPLSVTIISKIVWPKQAAGSLVLQNGKTVGSELLGQQFASDGAFWGRPSAVDHKTVPSGASNFGPTSQKLWEAIKERQKHFGGAETIPYDLLLASGSGLDPHIRPEAARFQAKRLAAHTGISEESVLQLINSSVESPTFGILGKERVNVLKLNLALQALKK